MKRLRHFLEFFALKVLMGIISCLPLRIDYLLGEKLGDILYLCLPKIRKRAMDNLNNAFPEKSNNEIKKIAKNTYRNFGKRIIEFIILPQIKDEIISSTEVIGLEYLEEIKDKKMGAVILTAHMGSWPVMGITLSKKISPLYNIIRLQRNKMVGLLIKRQLEILGMKVIMEQDLKGTISALREGKLVEFLWDQDAGKNGIFCEFFKRPASTSPGPIILSMRTNTPIFFIIDVFENNRHKVIIEKPIYPKRTKNSKEEIANMAEELTRYLECHIRKYPDQWFWLHNRWATKK
ncbi:MAG: hypothetical protein AB1595_07000 [bacterium]